MARDAACTPVDDLASLQRALAAALVMQPPEAACVDPFAGDPGRARRRLRLYRGNVQANARKALRNAYPVCAAIVGDAYFDALADVYAASTPSTSGDLNEYGDRLAAFLSGFPPAREVPYLPDVAQLEWSVHRAHYAADVPAFDIATLAAISADAYASLRVALHPACTLMDSKWPVARIWNAHRDESGAPEDVDPDAGGERAIVYRPHFRVEVCALDAADYAFLDAAAFGGTMAEAFAAALRTDPAFTLDAKLPDWVGRRIVVGLA